MPTTQRLPGFTTSNAHEDTVFHAFVHGEETLDALRARLERAGIAYNLNHSPYGPDAYVFVEFSEENRAALEAAELLDE